MEILMPSPNSPWIHSYPWNVSIRKNIELEVQKQSYGRIGLMPGWSVRSIDPYCDYEAKGTVFNVCHDGFGCDKLSRYSEPRSSFHLDHEDPLHIDNLSFRSVTCYRLRKLNCPTSMPIALRIHMKAGSTAATLWAAALEEFLLPRLGDLRSEARQALDKGEPSGWLMWYLTRLADEVVEMSGCNLDPLGVIYQQSLAVRFLSKRFLGSPLALSPTCCSSGVGRLRVAFVRHPFARLWSHFDTWISQTFTGSFELWISQMLDAWPQEWNCQQSIALREFAHGVVPPPLSGIHAVCMSPWDEVRADVSNHTSKWRFTHMDWEHLAPIARAIHAEGHKPEHFFPFKLESPSDSLASLTQKLCDEYSFCPARGLPKFPPSPHITSRYAHRSGSSEWPQKIREGLAMRYQEDFSTFGYTVAWHPKLAKMR